MRGRAERGTPEAKTAAPTAQPAPEEPKGTREARVAAPSVGAQAGGRTASPKPKTATQTPLTKAKPPEPKPLPEPKNKNYETNPKLKPTPRKLSRKEALQRITVFVARGGPARGDADYELAFPSRPRALAFLANQHGLTVEEQRRLAKASKLKLNRRWHGSDACVLREVALDPDAAARVLAGEPLAAAISAVQ